MNRLRRLLTSLCLALLAAVGGLRAGHADEGAPETDSLSTAHYRIDYAPSMAGLATRLVDNVEGWHGRIYGELGAEPRGTTTITLMPDERDMFAAIARKHPGSRPPEWASGLAFPKLRSIFLRGDVPAEELLTTAQHEISHVALGAATGAGPHVPIWFSEGVAIRQSEPVAFERIWLLTESALVDKLLPLSELDRGYPTGGGRVGVGYAQSVHFVGFLVSRYGEAKFQALVRALGNPGATFESTLAEVYGRPLAGIENDWRETLGFWWGWIPVVFIGTSFWAILGLLLIWAWRRRRREQSARIRALAGREAEDLAEDVEIAHGLQPPPGTHDPYDGRPPSIH